MGGEARGGRQTGRRERVQPAPAAGGAAAAPPGPMTVGRPAAVGQGRWAARSASAWRAIPALKITVAAGANRNRTPQPRLLRRVTQDQPLSPAHTSQGGLRRRAPQDQPLPPNRTPQARRRRRASQEQPLPPNRASHKTIFVLGNRTWVDNTCLPNPQERSPGRPGFRPPTRPRHRAVGDKEELQNHVCFCTGQIKPG